MELRERLDREHQAHKIIRFGIEGSLEDTALKQKITSVSEGDYITLILNTSRWTLAVVADRVSRHSKGI